MHDENHKMISSSREEEAATKQGVTQANDGKVTTSSRLWTSLKNPRIVRVSRSFGGKDRHSKVTTVRGLRDRRVRLSVPTAIQLYDLQDKLGLNQPSKVVDWLLNKSQHEIDKLPPLEIPPGNLMHFPQSMPVIFDKVSSPKVAFNHKVGNADGNFLHDNKDSHRDNASSSSFNTNLADMTMYPKSMNCSSDHHDLIRMKEKEAVNEEEPKSSHDYKGSNSKGNEVGNHEGFGLMNNIAMPYNSYFQLEPSTAAYLSYMRSHSIPSPEMQHGYHPIPMFTPSTTTSLDAKQYGYFQLASFPSENVTSNHRGYMQSGNSNMMRVLHPNEHHGEQHHK